MIDTIIFDAEGVVIDTESIWDKGQEEFLRRRGFVYDRERIKPLLTGRSLREGVEIMRQAYGFSGDAKALTQERIDIVKNIFTHEVAFIPGFEEFFHRARQLYKTCIATAMAEELLAIVDQRLHLTQLFDGHVFSLTHVGNRSKPDPALFLYAAGQLQSQPEHCLVIEDAPLGVQAAKAAQMRCIGLTTTYTRERLEAADCIVDAYTQITLPFP